MIAGAGSAVRMGEGEGSPAGMDVEARRSCGTTVASGVGSDRGVLEESPWHDAASNVTSNRMVAENRTVYLALQVPARAAATPHKGIETGPAPPECAITPPSVTSSTTAILVPGDAHSRAAVPNAHCEQIAWLTGLPETSALAPGRTHISAWDASMAPNRRRGWSRPGPLSGADRSTEPSGSALYQPDLSIAQPAPQLLKSRNHRRCRCVPGRARRGPPARAPAGTPQRL